MAEEVPNGTQPNARARRKRRPPWKPKFLEILRSTGNVSAAAEEAGITRRAAYKARSKSQKFAAQWDEAIDRAIERLELEARRRAYTGVEKGVYYRGQRVDTVREYSDQLLIVLLKAHKPEKYRERYEHTGADGGPISVDQTVHHPDANVLAEILRIREETGDTQEGEA